MMKVTQRRKNQKLVHLDSSCHTRSSVKRASALDLPLHLVKAKLCPEQKVYDVRESKMEEFCAMKNEFLTNSCPHCIRKVSVLQQTEISLMTSLYKVLFL